MKRRIFSRIISGLSMLAVLLMISSCDLMDGTKRSFESVAVEDVIANSNLSQAVEYSYVAEGHERHKLDFYKYIVRS